MNNSDIVRLLADRLSCTQKEARRLLSETVEAMAESLGSYVGFSIPNLGTFDTHVRDARQAYSPHYDEIMNLPPKRLVSFHPSQSLKEGVSDVEVNS